MDLDKIVEILRANEMHEPHCLKLCRERAQKRSDMYIKPEACDCWLSK